jgi:hypothetical protein
MLNTSIRKIILHIEKRVDKKRGENNLALLSPGVVRRR